MASFRQLLGGLFGGRQPAAHDAPAKPKLDSYQNENWIPLQEAVKMLYDELEGTQWRAAADREDTLELRLDYMALHLVHNAPIEGRSPPMNTHKPIPATQFDEGIFKGGGKYFQRYYESYLTYLDMRVRVDDLREAVRKLKSFKGGLPE